MNNILELNTGFIKTKHKIITHKEGSYPFIVILKDNEIDKIIYGDYNSYHSDNELFNRIQLNKNLFYYVGRIWIKEKCIAFHNSPKNEDLNIILNNIEKHFKININSIEWFINIQYDIKLNKSIKEPSSYIIKTNNNIENLVCLIQSYYNFQKKTII